MDVVEVWNGHHACALQAALRMTNEAFAERLGIAPRTVAAWHANPDVVLRRDTQQMLDVVYEDAAGPAQRRFALMLAPDRAPFTARGDQSVQPLRVAIAVVVHEGQVLLVCRRDEGSSGISWQFPAGVIKPGMLPDSAAVRETLNETGVRCAVTRSLGTRLHPVTAVQCDYFLCEFLAGEAVNSDVDENVDVMWAPKASITRFIPVSNIFPPILTALEDPHDAANQR
ncbi:NUDIX domain-containing protein [Streptomyces scabiei]|uniref:NUDIX domain-containing protein n=1 Tax=Streptomyces scabiei TaxID=1930 RepID=UPI001B302B38|nr:MULTISPECIES: NUDIX domain-containing protein [Streptomyces]MDX3121584.1 NUDIX domain-containing protein [Streptomyces scabiei]MDX3520388.1 NUDIX domain-containing protein [Streptomyces scabiei]QTU46848.1 NUDIX domain-containing protein [Streptomyces sp. LBUM 1482]